jgi:hypothetical protein
LPKADDGEIDRVTSEDHDDATITVTYSSLQGWDRLARPFAGVAIQATPDAAVDAIIAAAAGRPIGRLKIMGHGDRGNQSFTIESDLRRVAEDPELVAALTRLIPHFAPGADVELQGCLVGSGYAGALLLDDLAYIWREKSAAVIAASNFQRPLVPGWEGHVHARRYIDGRGTWWDDFGSAGSVRRWYFRDLRAVALLHGVAQQDPLTDLVRRVQSADNVRLAGFRHRALMAGLQDMNGQEDPARAATLGRAVLDLLAAVTPDERYYFFVDLYASRSPRSRSLEDADTWWFLTDGMAPDSVLRLQEIILETSITQTYDAGNLRGVCGDARCGPTEYCSAERTCTGRL